MKAKSLVLSTGLAMFSMFFGSGNLVFPLVVGQLSEGHYWLAAFGIILTGVLVPFLGTLAILLFNGDQNAFFGRLGRLAAFLIPLVCLSIMGPFGVLARCITVAHGTFHLLFPNVSLWTFSGVSCLILFLLTIRKSRLISLLGSILTPLLLLSLAAICFFAISSVELPKISLEESGAWSSFSQGIFQGYQTMDLLAAFFFSAFIIKHLNSHPHSGSPLPIFMKASLLGAGLLTSVYFLLVLMGAMYAPELASIRPEEMLGFIAEKTLGSFGAPVVVIAVVLACATTATVLALLYADFLRKEIAKDKIPQWLALSLTLGIAFCTSTLEFSGIARIIGPILEVCYPALIVLALTGICQKLWNWKLVRTPAAIAFLLKLFSLGI